MITRRVYADNRTGDLIWHYSVNEGIKSTVDQDFAGCYLLKDRVRDTVQVLEFRAADYEQDFLECASFKLDAETGSLVFAYPDPNAPQAPPVYQVPLTEQVAELKSQNSEIILTLVMNDLM